MRPEFVENERAAELAVMTLLAIAGAKRAELSAFRHALLTVRHVNTAGPVTAFTTDVD